jgi:hypothetical protein
VGQGSKAKADGINRAMNTQYFTLLPPPSGSKASRPTPVTNHVVAPGKLPPARQICVGSVHRGAKEYAVFHPVLSAARGTFAVGESGGYYRYLFPYKDWPANDKTLPVSTYVFEARTKEAVFNLHIVKGDRDPDPKKLSAAESALFESVAKAIRRWVVRGGGVYAVGCKNEAVGGNSCSKCSALSRDPSFQTQTARVRASFTYILSPPRS